MAGDLFGTVVSDSAPGEMLRVRYEDGTEATVWPPDFAPEPGEPFPHVVPRGSGVEVRSEQGKRRVVTYSLPDAEHTDASRKGAR